MNEADAARIFRLNLKLSTETLTEAAPEIEALGLEPKEFFVLDGLEDRPYPAELARYLSMPRPTITAYLKNFQARGLIGRAIDPKDLRRQRLELTQAGRETLVRARNILTDRYRLKLARLDQHEQKEFAALLYKICS